MTQADSVLSTPPTNTSAIPSRRSFLAQSAMAGAAAAVALSIAPAMAGIGTEADPIFAAIERHRELSALYDAASDISCNLHPGAEFDAAEEISAARSRALIDHADDLICSEPTRVNLRP